MGIESILNVRGGRSAGLRDGMCTAYEMAVVWMKNRLNQNESKERVLNYANELCECLPSPLGESAVECTEISSMPEVSFTIGGKVFKLSPDQDTG